MSFIVTIVHIFVCVFLMLTVLLQAGKGGGMGATFGGGSSQGSVFGGSGAGNFLSRLTTASAAVFMLTSMTLAFLASTTGEDSMKQYSAQQREAAKQKAERDKAAKDKYQSTQPDAPETDTPEGAELIDEVAPVDGEAVDPATEDLDEAAEIEELPLPGADEVPAPAEAATPEAVEPEAVKPAVKPEPVKPAVKPEAVKPAASNDTAPELTPAAVKPAATPKPAAPAPATAPGDEG